MNVKVKNVIRNIKDKITFIQTIYEAISNSLEANANLITITFRKLDSTVEDESYTDEFYITDNGDGFTEDNQRSFLEYYSDKKLNLGCKGVGRFTWLKVFDSIHITSYVNNKKIESFFNDDFDEKFINSENYEKHNYTTKIEFENCILNQKDLLKLDLDDIKSKILEHFIIKLNILNKKSVEFNIILNVENSNQYISISNNDLFELDKIEFSLYEFKLPVNFNLFYCFTNSLNSSKIVLCANNRGIEDINKGNKIVNSLENNDVIICFVESKYLDDIVNDTRTEFLFSKNGEQLITRKDLAEKIESVLKNIIYERYPTVKTKNIEIQNECINEFPYLENYIIKDNSIVKDKNAIIKNAHNEFEEEKEKVRKEFKKTFSNPHINEDELIETIATINDFSNKELAQYILYRQQIIDCLKRLNNNDEKQEELLHNLFVPKGEKITEKLSDKLKNNIWLLDDKFMSCENMFSDIKVKTIKSILGEKSKDFDVEKEPDLTIFYKNKTAVVVEFKAIGARNIDKLFAIAEINRNNGIIAKNIGDISMMFSYIITKFNQELIDELALQQGVMKLFTNSINPMFYFFNGNIQNESGNFIPCHTFILSTESICNDADERNKLFIDILRKRI